MFIGDDAGTAGHRLDDNEVFSDQRGEDDVGNGEAEFLVTIWCCE